MAEKKPDRRVRGTLLDTSRPPTPEERELTIAETEWARAERDKLLAEAEEARADAQIARIALRAKEESEAERHAADKYQHIYVFSNAVADNTVASCIFELDTWRRLNPGCDITIRFYSPGGDVIAGMYLYDHIQGLRRAGHHVTTEAYGYAASMAGILLQAGDHRVVGRESYILIHEVQFSVRGKVGEVEDEMEFVKKIAERILNIFAAGAEKAKLAGTATKPLSKAQFKGRWTRKDWWLTSEEALSYGVVDEVR